MIYYFVWDSLLHMLKTIWIKACWAPYDWCFGIKLSLAVIHLLVQSCIQDYESDEKFTIPDDRISHLLPTSYQDMIVKVYAKKPELVSWIDYWILCKFELHCVTHSGWIHFCFVQSYRWRQFQRLLKIFSWKLMGSKHRHIQHHRRSVDTIHLYKAHSTPFFSFFVPPFFGILTFSTVEM